MTQAMDIDDEDFKKLVQECSLYLLNRHTTNLPIKRADIVKALLNDTSRKTQTEVIKRASETIRRIHGLKLLELNENPKAYLLINVVPPLEHVELNWDEAEKKTMILLFLVLSVIYMNGNNLPERGLIAFLRKLRIISADSFVSAEFGDVDRILKKDFVQQRYIVYETVVKGDPENEDVTYTLHWGPRAEHEVKKELVLEYVCEILECEMSQFTEQFANMTA